MKAFSNPHKVGRGFHRVDLTTGEQVYIKPQPLDGDPYERFNWDTPILVSPHNPAKIYIASHRVWESEIEEIVGLQFQMIKLEMKIELNFLS